MPKKTLGNESVFNLENNCLPSTVCGVIIQLKSLVWWEPVLQLCVKTKQLKQAVQTDSISAVPKWIWMKAFPPRSYYLRKCFQSKPDKKWCVRMVKATEFSIYVHLSSSELSGIRLD